MALYKKIHEAVCQQKNYTQASELLRQASSADHQVTEDQYQKLLSVACVDGQLEVIQLILEIFHIEPEIRTHALWSAIWHGHYNIVKYLMVDGGCKPTPEHLNIAITTGHFDIMKYLIGDGGCKPTTKHLDTAFHLGHFDIVKLLIFDGGCKPTTKHLDTAIQRGYFDIVKYLVVDGGCKPTAEHLYTAIERGHFDIVKCLVVDGGYKPTIEHLDTAIQRGYFDIVKYLVVDGGCKPTAEYLYTAIERGHFDIVKYLVVDGGCKPTTRHLDTAIERGYFDIIKFLVIDGRCNPTTEHLDAAIRREDFDIVKYLVVDGGCKSTAKHLFTAIERGHLDIVKYLVFDGGCKPTAEHLAAAIQREHSNIVNYLVVDGGCRPTTNHLLDTAIQRGHFNTVKYLVVYGRCKPATEHLDTAVLMGDFDIVKCLVLHGGCKPTTQHLFNAVLRGDFDIVKCLVVFGGCKPTTKHIDSAIQMGYFDIVKYLVDDKCKQHAEHLDTAIQKNYFSTVKYLVVDGGYKPTTKDLFTAIERGHFDIVKCLVIYGGCKPTSEHLDSAILMGQCDIVKYLVVDGGCKPATEHLNTAFQRGDLIIVKCLVICGGCKLTTKDLDSVILMEHFDIMQWIVVDGGCKPTNDHLETAIQRGHFDIVKCLVVDGGCKPTTENLNTAIQKGNFNITKYLIVECGYKPTTELIYTAIMNNASEIAKLLIFIESIDLNSRVGPNQRNVFHAACITGKMDIVTLLIKTGRCNIEEKDGEGNNALHLACYYQQCHIVKALLDTGKYDLNIRNMDNNAPLDLSDDPEIVRELIKYGANPSNVYKRFGIVFGNSPRRPIEAPVKVFVTGDPRGGKSTLTKSLQEEASALTRVLSRAKKVSDVDEKTAGIIPYQFESKQYGSVTFYDLAGQREFYSSHAAVLNSTICSSPPIFLLVINLQKNEEELIKQNILYWLSFLENQCSSVNGKPHVIVVGSYADILKSRGEDPKKKGDIVRATIHDFNSTWFEFSGFIPMDCRYPHSSKIARLRQQLDVCCKALRVTSTIQFNCHCLLVYLIHMFSNCPPVTLQQVRDEMLSVSDKKSPSMFVPLNMEVMLSMCEQLYERGHILFLKNETKEGDSWIIIDKEPLLSEVTGTVFAPEGFKQHCKLASSTGVVPLSEIVCRFPKHNSDMLISFFSHLEYCREIYDQETLKLIEVHQSHGIPADSLCMGETNSYGAQSFNPSIDRYFLFSGLVTIDRPDQVWYTDSQFSFKCGWMLQCSQQIQFFSSRFLQVLLLRIAFEFALVHHRKDLNPDLPALERKCSIWSKGIFWGDRNGVEMLVEVLECKTVIILMRSRHLTGECLQLRTSVINKVLKTATDLCPQVPTTESFINPSETLQYPIDSVSELTCFSISEVAVSVSSGNTAVVTTTGKSFLLQSILTIEPYAKLSTSTLNKLFDETKEEEEVTDELLDEISPVCSEVDPNEASHLKLTRLQKCVNKNGNFLRCVGQYSRENSVHRCFLLLQIQKDQTAHPALQTLRRVLDQHSVFGGRNPMKFGGVVFSSSYHSDTICKGESGEQQIEEEEAKVKEEEKSWRMEEAEEEVKKKPEEVAHSKDITRSVIADTSQSHSCSDFSSQFFVLDDLGFLMESLCQAAPQWYFIGLQLGVHPTDLDIIRHNYSLFLNSPMSYLREMLKTWLCLASPQAGSLPTLLSALKSETVRESRLANSVEKKSIEYLTRTPRS